MSLLLKLFLLVLSFYASDALVSNVTVGVNYWTHNTTKVYVSFYPPEPWSEYVAKFIVQNGTTVLTVTYNPGFGISLFANKTWPYSPTDSTNVRDLSNEYITQELRLELQVKPTGQSYDPVVNYGPFIIAPAPPPVTGETFSSTYESQGKGSLSASWPAVVDPKNFPISGYLLSCFNPATPGTFYNASTNTTSATLTNLNLGTSYNCSITTVGLFNTTNNASLYLLATSPKSFPVTIQIHNGSALLVTWSPTEGNGLPVLDYTITCATNPALSQTVTVVTATSGETSALIPAVAGTVYYCGGSARNDRGSSPLAQVAGPFKLETVPTAPENLTSTNVLPELAYVNWTAATSNGNNILRYDVSFYLDNGPLITVYQKLDLSHLSQELRNLIGDTTYRVEVTAVNGVGVGPAVAVTFTTLSSKVPTSLSVSSPNCQPVTDGILNLCSTTGDGTVISFTGAGFSTYGPPRAVISTLDGSYFFPCIETNPWNDTHIDCGIPSGAGRNLSVVLYSGEAQTRFTDITINYPAPTITPNTLRRDGQTTPENPLALDSGFVRFDGLNFGTYFSHVSIFYGPLSNRTQLVCTLESVTHTSVSCFVPRGTGNGYVFTIMVGGQQADGTDIFNYPSTPVISSLNSSACISNGAALRGCPTKGGATITLHGQYFSFPLQVSIKGSFGTDVSVQPDGTQATFTLPSGTGVNLPVIATIGSTYISNTTAQWLSYALPQIDQAQGCANSTAPVQTVTGCNRAGGDSVTIIGTNFGFSGAKAFVGGYPCAGTTHVMGSEYEKIVCVTPSGTAQDLAFSVYQYEGEISDVANAKLSYSPCPIGTYYDGLSCYPCAAGFYNDKEDQASCRPCAAGTATNQTGATSCTLAPAGFIAAASAGGTELTMFVPCGPGTYSAPQRAECIPCLPGTFQNESAQITCKRCEAGSYAASSGLANCVPCPAGQFVLRDGATTCDECAAGSYTPSTGHVQCQTCEVGRYANSTGSSVCRACESGYAAAAGAVQCDECVAGYYGFGNTAQCTPCAIGSYQSSTGQSLCLSCGNGTYANYTGAQSCTPCPANTWTPTSDRSECTQCPPGETSGGGINAFCSACPVGTTGYTDKNGCAPCKPGTGGPGCLPCADGKYSQGGILTSCLECEFGTVSANETGSTYCINAYVTSKASQSGFIVLSTFGMLFVVITAIVFFIILRNHPALHRTGNSLLPLTLLGFVFLYLAVILWIAPSTVGSCTAKHWFLNLGYTLVIGTLCLKSYFLDRVFNKEVTKSAAVDLTKLKSLWGILGGVLGADLLILIIWAGAAPFAIEARTERCVSAAIPAVIIVQWLIKAAYGVILLVLLIKTQKIDRRFRGSHFLAVGLYNIGVVCIVLIAVSLGTDLTPMQWTFFFDSLLIYLTTTLLFLVVYPTYSALCFRSRKAAHTFGVDIEKDIAEAKDAMGEESTTTPTEGTTELDKHMAQFAKTRGELESLLGKVQKDKAALQEDMDNVNKLKENLVHLNEKIEFLKKNPQEGGRRATSSTSTPEPQQSGDVAL